MSFVVVSCSFATAPKSPGPILARQFGPSLIKKSWPIRSSRPLRTLKALLSEGIVPEKTLNSVSYPHRGQPWFINQREDFIACANGHLFAVGMVPEMVRSAGEGML